MASFAALMKEKGKNINITDIIIPKIQMINYKQLKSSKKNFYRQDRIEELADSIELVGMVLEPLIVCKIDMGEYEVIAGHRRLAACTYNVEQKGLKKFTQIPCIEIIAGDLIKDMIEEYKENGMDADEAMDVFAEYILIATNSTARGELTDYEKVMQAARLQIIIPIMHGDENLKGRALRAEIAKEMNKSNGTIGNYMNIYNNLIPAGMEMLEHGLIGITIAAKICSLSEDAQEELLKQDRITDADILKYKQPDPEVIEKEDYFNTGSDKADMEQPIQAEQEEVDLFSDEKTTANYTESISEDNDYDTAKPGAVMAVDKADMAAVEANRQDENMTVKEDNSKTDYSDVNYGKEDVSHLLEVYKRQVDSITAITRQEGAGQQGNENVLKKSLIIRDALNMYLQQFK